MCPRGYVVILRKLRDAVQAKVVSEFFCVLIKGKASAHIKSPRGWGGFNRDILPTLDLNLIRSAASVQKASLVNWGPQAEGAGAYHTSSVWP